MLSAKQAEAIILDLVQPLNSLQDLEIIDLETADQRILASSVISKLDFPYWDNSAMDGYAVCYEDVINSSLEHPTVLEIIEEIPAGYQPKQTVKFGQAARIFTGAMMPEGADTIVIQENTQKEGNQVKILAAPQPKEFVRHRGSFYQTGEPMLQAGIVLNAPEIAVLATAQCTKIPVYRRPKVAILSTGDELITPNQAIQPGQIVDSNQYALASFVLSNRAIPVKLGIIPDDRQQLQNAIASAIESADFVLSTGGVSVGDYDYVEQILAQLRGKIEISSVAVKPGKPLTVAKFDNGCVYFGIPGNPVSALVSCWRFVQPALKKLSGLKDDWQPKFIKVRTRDRLVAGGKRETYLWGNLQLVNGIYEFNLAGGSHSSGNLINLAQTNSLAVIPIGQIQIAAGEEVEVMQVTFNI